MTARSWLRWLAATAAIAPAVCLFAVRIPDPAPTFGDLYRPASHHLDTSGATARLVAHRPAWGAMSGVPWDAPGSFTAATALEPVKGSTGPWREFLQDNGGGMVSGPGAPKGIDLSFSVTGRRFALRFTGDPSSDAHLWLDGRPLSRHSFTTPVPGGQYWLDVHLPEESTVNVRFAGPTAFQGIDFPQSSPTVVRAVKDDRYTLAVLSDSYLDGGPPGVILGSDTGFRILNISESGTGYVHDGSLWPPFTYDGHVPTFKPTADGSGVRRLGKPLAGFSPYGSPSRLAVLKRESIDALLVNGSLNDMMYPDPATVGRAADRFLTRVQCLRPDLPVVMVGIEPVRWNRLVQRDLEPLSDTLRRVAARHSNVVLFVDPRAEGWLTGLGSQATPTGHGNQDRYVSTDRIHLSPDGLEHFMRRLVRAMRDVPATLPRADRVTSCPRQPSSLTSTARSLGSG